VTRDFYKALYSGVDELKSRKADKDQVQIEVDEVIHCHMKTDNMFVP